MSASSQSGLAYRAIPQASPPEAGTAAETEPLLQGTATEEAYTFEDHGVTSPRSCAAPPDAKDLSIHKSILQKRFEKRDAIRDQCAFYRADDILSWSALYKTGGTVWRRKTLWWCAAKMFVVSLLCASFILAVVKDPSRLAAGKFLKISTFLNVFVGLLIGFFLSSSMVRWYNSADGVVELCTAVRNIQRELISLDVDDKKIENIIRYGVLSGWLLDMELNIENLAVKDRQDAWVDAWVIIQERCKLAPEEQRALSLVNSPSTVIWVWVGSLIGRMAKDGTVPPKTTPTYCRLMGLTSQAANGIRQVRMATTVRPPYLYAQMMAVLVHINNMINAISFGLTLGVAVGVFLMRFKVDLGASVGTEEFDGRARFGEVARDSQNLMVSFFFSCAGPFIYQALLEVAVAIAQPFSSPEGAVPTRWLLMLLERDLKDSRHLVDSMPTQEALTAYDLA